MTSIKKGALTNVDQRCRLCFSPKIWVTALTITIILSVSYKKKKIYCIIGLYARFLTLKNRLITSVTGVNPQTYTLLRFQKILLLTNPFLVKSPPYSSPFLICKNGSFHIIPHSPTKSQIVRYSVYCRAGRIVVTLHDKYVFEDGNTQIFQNLGRCRARRNLLGARGCSLPRHPPLHNLRLHHTSRKAPAFHQTARPHEQVLPRSGLDCLQDRRASEERAQEEGRQGLNSQLLPP